ncbi:hypothetical protein B0H19DRAFT_956069, partial [Mycena capillaripes]
EIVLKTSWQVNNRKDVEMEMYEAAAGAFGTPTVFGSYQGRYPNGETISNCLFLPTLEELEQDPDHHLPIFGPFAAPEIRTLCFTVFITIGRSLTEAPSSYSICMALAHALLGWLSYYLADFMHRDVSIGNILLAEGEAVSQKRFAIAPDSSLRIPLWLGSSPGLTDSTKLADDILVRVEGLQIAENFSAFLTDGDMATKWSTYFDANHDVEVRSGTTEFMSLELQRAMEADRPYVQSPVDDIQSFFWVAAWAVLFNTRQQNRSPEEDKWCRDLISGNLGLKSDFSSALLAADLEEGYGLAATQLFPVLRLWWVKLLSLRMDWVSRVTSQVRKQPPDEVANFYLHHFHLFALRGVQEFLELVEEHHSTLRNYGDFPSS